MGNDFSSYLDSCGTSSSLNVTSRLRKRRQEQEEEQQLNMFFLSDLLGCLDNEDLEESELTPQASQPRQRSIKKIRFESFDANGNLVPLDPRLTSWYCCYVLHPQLNKPKFFRKFRRRFRLPYDKFLELVDMCKEAKDNEGNLYFRRWMSEDCVGVPSSPIELMVLGSLRYLGRGWTFDDIEEATAIDEETHRQFFHIFIKFGAEYLYNLWVQAPTSADVHDHLHEMTLAGMPGCPGSTDATHIVWHRCAYNQRQSHLGFKMPHTARTFNLTVNHRRLILSTTVGYPGRWNDKTLVMFDEFVRGMYEGKVLDDVEFVLLEEDESGNIVERTYKGAWLVVDNGYLKWATTIPPLKHTADAREIRWSQWLESMRKDVECTFGILKGRWRILKAGVSLRSAEAMDRVWKTCCSLHNWLLNVDGLNVRWNSGVPSDWEGELGQHDHRDVLRHAVPNAIRNLQSPAELRRYDGSGLGVGVTYGNDVDDEILMRNATNAVYELGEIDTDGMDTPQDTGGVRIVRKLSQEYFRKRLVEHFDICWRRNDIVWPRRMRVAGPRYP
jgi:hypothetical protein